MLSMVRSDERITTLHRAKIAFVYIRQSSAGQVRHHQESTALQYRLVDRAVGLGWPRERVEVIDEDLGKSGANSEQRYGFQRLIAEVGLGHAGLVLSFDASRLARNNRDWHQLLELCSLFSVLIADSERLYDSAAYHDRLLLGLSGIMSEAELHQIRLRMHMGERQKAARGELRMALPAGLQMVPGGGIMLNPDAEVQARLKLVFKEFSDLGSAKAVLRYLRKAALSLPMRPLLGPAPHETVWREATDARVRSILKNPAYAGAYVYGRRCAAPERRGPNALHPTKAVPPDEWEVCIRDAHPGYIGWEEFMSNRERLADNCARFRDGRRGIPRRGKALLQGIVKCGRCGRRMMLNYSGPACDYAVYRCRSDRTNGFEHQCQEVRGPQLESEVEAIVLAALAPDSIALTLAALDELNADTGALERQWALKRERAAYETERARRQYDAVEPENRLVARSLEAIWEDKLRAGERLEQEHSRWQTEQAAKIGKEERDRILALGSNLPELWQRMANADRKAMLRLLITEVIVDQTREKGQLWIRILWETGAATERRIVRHTHSYAQHAYTDQIEERVRALNAAGCMDAEIANILNKERLTSPRGGTYDNGTVHLLRQRWDIPTVKINGTSANPARWADGTYSVQGAAIAIGITAQTIFKWLKKGILNGRQLVKGQPWQVDLSEEQITQLRRFVRRTSPSRKAAS
jgi:DNA invertase Pin-like site-specific DNA recombinase